MRPHAALYVAIILMFAGGYIIEAAILAFSLIIVCGKYCLINVNEIAIIVIAIIVYYSIIYYFNIPFNITTVLIYSIIIVLIIFINYKLRGRHS